MEESSSNWFNESDWEYTEQVHAVNHKHTLRVSLLGLLCSTYMHVYALIQADPTVCEPFYILCRLSHWMKTWCASFPALLGATCAPCRLWSVGFVRRKWWRRAVESSTRSLSGSTMMLWSASRKMAVIFQKRNASRWALLQCFAASGIGMVTDIHQPNWTTSVSRHLCYW